MKTNYNVTGAERKALVQTISDHLGEKAKYRGMPSCAYLIGDFTVTKDGTLEFDDCTDSEIVEGLYEAIATAGFAFEEPAESATAYETADPAPLRTLAQEGLLKGWEEPVEEKPCRCRRSRHGSGRSRHRGAGGREQYTALRDQAVTLDHDSLAAARLAIRSQMEREALEEIREEFPERNLTRRDLERSIKDIDILLWDDVHINNRKTSEPKQRHAHAAEQER